MTYIKLYHCCETNRKPNQKFIYGAVLVIVASSWYYLGFFGMTTNPQFRELVTEGVSYIITFVILSVEEQT